MSKSADKTITELIKEKVGESGFDLCGIASSRILSEHEPVLRKWTSAGMNAKMHYLGRNIEKRINPHYLLPGTKSVLVTGLNYYTGKKLSGEYTPVISKYAYGDDYHEVILNKLNLIIEYIKLLKPITEGRAFVDFAPILEKAWAREAGLGWPGRHSILINKEIGSYFFIGIILLNIDLEYDKPYAGDHCVNCRLCMDACPVEAINNDRTIDARKCISYLTIESNEPLPEEVLHKSGRIVFGCDICQDVCPWNSKAKPHHIPEFELTGILENLTENDWCNLSEKSFRSLFRKSPIARTKYEVFMKNVTNVTNSKKI